MVVSCLQPGASGCAAGCGCGAGCRNWRLARQPMPASEATRICLPRPRSTHSRQARSPSRQSLQLLLVVAPSHAAACHSCGCDRPASRDRQAGEPIEPVEPAAFGVRTKKGNVDGGQCLTLPTLPWRPHAANATWEASSCGPPLAATALPANPPKPQRQAGSRNPTTSPPNTTDLQASFAA